MEINKKYLLKLYKTINRKTLEEMEIRGLEDLIDYIKATITSNLQYDLGLDVDINELFKTGKGE